MPGRGRGAIGAVPWDGDPESTPGPFGGVAEVQGAAQGTREVAGNGQAEPAATGVGGPRLVESGEPFEDAVAIGVGDTGPSSSTSMTNRSGRSSTVTRMARGRVALRILDEVDHDAAKVVGIQVSRERARPGAGSDDGHPRRDRVDGCGDHLAGVDIDRVAGELSRCRIGPAGPGRTRSG